LGRGRPRLTPPPAQTLRQAVQPGVYVRCSGAVRRFNNEWSVTAFAMPVITDYNHITHHFLECIFCRLQMTKGPLNTSIKSAQPGLLASPYGQPISAAAQGFVDNSGLSGNQKLVHDLVRGPSAAAARAHLLARSSPRTLSPKWATRSSASWSWAGTRASRTRR
jgi:hypothetical protein